MSSSLRITKRDKLILEHIASFRITTYEVLHGEFFEDKQLAAVKSTMRRLTGNEAGLVSVHKLPGQRKKYLRLTPKGGKLIGCEVTDKPFSLNTVMASYATLYFIAHEPMNIRRAKCGSDFLANFMDTMNYRLPRVDFYISQNSSNSADEPEISTGFVLCDFNSKIRRIVDRAVKHARNFIKREWFRDVMKGGRFEITILTGTEAKLKELELSLQQEVLRQLRKDVLAKGLNVNGVSPIKMKVVHIPGLADLRPFRRN
jgi:hypothetical protein